MKLFGQLEQQAEGRLRAWFDGAVGIERSAEMRYGEQVFEIDVPLDGIDWDAPDLVDRIEDRFHRHVTRSFTPMPRAARKWCSSMRASLRSAKSRDGIRTQSQHHRRPLFTARHTAGLLRRLAQKFSLRARRSPAGPHLDGAGAYIEPRPRRC